LKLPESYLEYSERSYGLDHDRHDWIPADRRDPLQLKSGKKAAAFIVVPLEFFPLDPPAKPFSHPGSMKTPYPDLRHYTTRDYGNRVGVYRILKALADVGLKATFAVNAAVADRYSPLLKAVEQAGHEIAAHGVSTAHIHHEGLSCQQEEEFIARCRAEFPDAKTWMSPARNQTYRTLDLLAKAGFEVCLDWEPDQRPLALRTENGSITSLPLMNELSDFTLLLDRRQQADDWARQILEAAQFHLDAYADAGAQCFGFTLTPYIVGQPFRVLSLKNLLSGLVGMPELEVVTAAQVSSLFLLPGQA
jgi:peptidoglycan/xylan/chitin deacetylase (PgdA/CDA1 family)